ncbi:flagellar hook assembly protein FlgD [Noviherbaspirillum saxi]|uniref:Basal-body rod modification protein FlgD n=1 Tax=Noviherbaspirillum saxi TaxID=2320863 RepID=A0A3A3FTU2_9BURK|nr:flagellar hook assembly protein FlgD [Noviherbaspirillum saxi]RJF98674.1 flagellar hook assembly protein FlgD [Noviherbaspirillum saxi]
MASVQTTNTVSTDLMAAMNGKKAETSTAVDAQDRFMKLLVTQMRNQDPLNPLDNAQVTSQLAQLSTVSGIDKLNTTLQALQSSYQTSQALQATDMIGHGVLVPGSSIELVDSKAILGVDFASAADKTKITVRNAAGLAVRTFDLGAQQAGIVPLAWDGKTDGGETAPDGSYKFEVSAVRGQENVTATTLSFGSVSSVTTGASGVKLSVPGIGNVNFADVRQVL